MFPRTTNVGEACLGIKCFTADDTVRGVLAYYHDDKVNCVIIGFGDADEYDVTVVSLVELSEADLTEDEKNALPVLRENARRQNLSHDASLRLPDGSVVRITSTGELGIVDGNYVDETVEFRVMLHKGPNFFTEDQIVRCILDDLTAHETATINDIVSLFRLHLNLV